MDSPADSPADAFVVWVIVLCTVTVVGEESKNVWSLSSHTLFDDMILLASVLYLYLLEFHMAVRPRACPAD